MRLRRAAAAHTLNGALAHAGPQRRPATYKPGSTGMSRNNEEAASEVLVTGASGFVGGHLTRALVGAGYHVRVLARATSDLSALEGLPYRRIDGDLGDPLSLPAAVDSVHYIFHAGGLIKAKSDDEFIRINGEGTKNLAATARAHAPDLKRFVYVSSMAAAGPGAGERPVDEDSPVHPITPYGASKGLGEKWLASFDLLSTVVRPPAVYGPGDHGMLDLFRMAARHIRPALGADGIVSVIYIDNLVDGLLRAAVRPEAVGQTFYLADEPILRRSEFARMIQAAVGTWAMPVHFPAWFVRLAARISGAVAAGFGRTAFFDSHKANELLATNWACKIDKARLLLRYEPAVATADGLKRTATWYRDAGWI
jgi:nucleoside-diphosphate-sugar epimerase